MSPEPAPVPSSALDRTGVIASVGCAIHCMVAPLILLFAPTFGGWWAHPSTHLAIAMLVLPIAGAALLRGHETHARRWILVVGACGMLLVLVGTVIPLLASSAADGACCPTLITDPETGVTTLDVPAATVLTFLGGIALISAHVGNIRGACATDCRHD